MSEKEVGFNKILYKLTLDLLSMLRDALTEPELNEDRLGLRILLRLSNPYYVNELLFRDFNLSSKEVWLEWPIPPQLRNNKVVSKEKIHSQSLVYWETVLTRRLTLANRQEDRPTNMHLLLEKLCQYGNPESFWESAEIKRDNNQIPQGNENFSFRRVAEQLAIQCQRLGSQTSEISQRRREQFGPFWLLLANCATEVPEELALFFDVLSALSLPLNPDFANDLKLQYLLNGVLESLNERYTLLRSCGLNPEDWMEREEPSIKMLRETKQLKRRAKELVQKKLRGGKELHLESAYRQIFNELKGEQKKFVGCHNFAKFAASEWGRIMLNYPTDYLNHTASDDDPDHEETLQDRLTAPDPESGYAQLGDEYNEEQDNKSAFNEIKEREDRCKLVETCSKQFSNDPVLVYFFCNNWNLNKKFPPADPKFKELLETNPDYAPLSEQELLTVLDDKVVKILKECNRLLRNYIINSRGKCND
jgi:hypothetical protein